MTPDSPSLNEDGGGSGPNPKPPTTTSETHNQEEHAVTVTTAPQRTNKVEFSAEIVTPDLAKLWLALNVDNNRKPRDGKITQYANDMRSGDWFDNGETIKFDTDDQLIDGQHRLAAIIEAGVPIEMTIARNVQPRAIKTIDTGVPRGFADVLKFGGGTDVNVTAAVVRRIILWDRGLRSTGSSGGGGASSAATSTSQLLERYESDVAGFRMAATRGRDVRTHTGGLLTSTTAGTAFYLFARIDYTAANDFFDRFISGANLGSGHPILTLRQRLLRAKNAERLKEAEKLALAIRAWNFYRSEEPCERLQVSGPQGLNHKNFPVPK